MNKLIEQQFKHRKQAFRRISFSTKEELEEMLEKGIKELDAGPGIPGNVALKSLRERAAARRHIGG